MKPDSLETLHQFTTELLDRHRQIQSNQDEDQTLVYAQALLNHLRLRPAMRNLPRQVVVIGPTQAGKSTLVNLLCGEQAAQANALAGFTRHAQGFSCTAIDDELSQYVAQLLPGMQLMPTEALSPDQLDCYALTPLQTTAGFLGETPCLVWDTPDFDSVSSRSYRSTVPRLCALADLILLVATKEKYADQSVWETLRLIGEIQRPLMVCINKMSADNEEALIAAIEKKFNQENITHNGIFTLPFIRELSHENLLQQDAGKVIREHMCEQVGGPVDPELSHLRAYLHSHWDSWASHLRQEHSANKRWQACVTQQTGQALERYRRDYLDNPHYHDAIGKAIVRLLELLEIPGIAASLTKVRNLVTLPAKKLLGYINQRRQSQATDAGNENLVLEEILRHMQNTLQHQAGEQSAEASSGTQDWWKQLWMDLQQEKNELDTLVEQGLENYRQAFAPEIDAAAEHLYEHLKSHPATLNSLRAARTSADAAGVVLALKTGGIGLNDLILTPAMLSFTSMLTESAVGHHMQKVEKSLKEKQAKAIQTHILDPAQHWFYNLPKRMQNTPHYGISEQDLSAAENALKAL